MSTGDYDLLIRAGRLFCAATGLDGPGAVAVRGDRIVAAGVVHAVDTYRALLTAILTGGSDADGAR